MSIRGTHNVLSDSDEDCPDGARTPQAAIHSSGDAVPKRSLLERRQANGGSSASLAHVFPWQRSSTPPFGDDGTETGLQVFEPLNIGDMTPTPSEWSEGQFSSARQSPESWRRESESVVDRSATPTEPVSRLDALAKLDSASILESTSDSSDEDSVKTPVNDAPFGSLAMAAKQLHSPARNGVSEPASPAVSVIGPCTVQVRRHGASPDYDSASERDSTRTRDAWREPTKASQSPPEVHISRIANRYMLFDTDAISYLRRAHNICGVLIGTLPSHPQQNVFLGAPLELMPEEARRLVEIGAAYIVDDVARHASGIMDLDRVERRAFVNALEQQGLEAMRAGQKRAEDIRKEVIKKHADRIDKARAMKQQRQHLREPNHEGAAEPSQTSPPAVAEHRFHITPSTSFPPLSIPPSPLPSDERELPKVPRSYPLFAYLHSRGFFLSPGLRFGCQYCVYPGDPLRFHSHFLAVGIGWDDEFDLVQLVGGGRLGTGVKKGFLVGGRETSGAGGGGGDEVMDDGERDAADGVRVFSIEWSGM